jgi:hypothetical protein
VDCSIILSVVFAAGWASSSAGRAYMSRGAGSEDRVLRCEVEGPSLSNFRRFADIFASNVLCVVADLAGSSAGVATGG